MRQLHMVAGILATPPRRLSGKSSSKIALASAKRPMSRNNPRFFESIHVGAKWRSRAPAPSIRYRSFSSSMQHLLDTHGMSGTLVWRTCSLDGLHTFSSILLRSENPVIVVSYQSVVIPPSPTSYAPFILASSATMQASSRISGNTIRTGS
jgi:hypothetical protein